MPPDAANQGSDQANRLVLLAVSLSASTFVVTQVLFSNQAAAGVAAGVAVLFAVVWFVVPLVARFHRGLAAKAPDSPDAR